MRKTDGFTLIELMVAIVCSALVTGAVITFMLMGLDTNRSVMDANADQRNARIVISMMENLANEGSITELKVDGDLTVEDGELKDDGQRSWTLCGSDGTDLLYFSPDSATIYGRNHSILMEGVKSSMLSMSPSPLGGCLLGFAIQTDDGFYETSIYNRVAVIKTEGIVLDQNNFDIVDSNSNKTIDVDKEVNNIDMSISASIPGRKAFLETLISQYGSTGTIIHDGAVSPIPYSLWYSVAEGNKGYLPGWDENTPWCAIFISWAIEQNKANIESPLPRAAEVYDAEENNLWALVNGFSKYSEEYKDYIPTPGDLIFFDWHGQSGGSFDLEHVGVILYQDVNYIYTIEGNSGNRVALRRYLYTDANTYIYGYGVLNWKTT